MRRGWLVIVSIVGSFTFAQAACISDDNAAPGADAGTLGDSALEPVDASTDTALAVDTSAPLDTSPPLDTSIADTSAPAETSTEDTGADANDAADGALPAVVLMASSTNVTTESSITLTATLNGVTATSIEIDDGATAIATLTAGPYTDAVSLTFLENGTHSYTAKATLAGSQIVTSAPVVVTVNVPANGYFVDAVNGNDSPNTGAQGSPFKTIAKAAGLLTAAGQSIYLAPATYDSATQTTMHFTFAHSTNVRALADGVILTGIAAEGNGNAFAFQAGGEVRNVAITHQYGGINVTGGTFQATKVTLDNVYDGFYFQGSSVATVDETGIATPVTNVPGAAVAAIVTADGSSVVTFIGDGGSLNAGGGVYNPFFVRGSGTLTVNDFSISNCGSHAVVLYDNGHLTLNDVSIQTSGLNSSGSDSSAIAMGGENTAEPLTSSLTINGGGITHNPFNAIVLSLYSLTPTTQTPTITLSNTHVDSNGGNGLWLAGDSSTDTGLTTLTVTNTTFTANTGVGILAPRANLGITGGAVSSNTGAGLQITDGTRASTLKIRGTSFAGNGADFIDFNGAASSTLDLGTTGDPGGLVFTSVPATFVAVSLQTAIDANAVGDTWIANQQGADATGKYTTPTTITSSTAAGSNAKVVAGGTLVVE